MYKFFQRNQKKLLAVFAAGLMIVFILPAGLTRMNNGQDAVAGYIGSEKVHVSRLAEVAREWLILKNVPGNQQGYPLPLLALGEDLTLEVDPEIIRRDSPPAHPELYLLLQREAEQSGVVVSDKEVEEFANRYGQYMVGRDPDEARAAIRGLMMVESLMSRISGAVKVSEPLVDRVVAERFQAPVLRMVEFKAEPLATTLPAPTTQQLVEQFDKYASVPASQPVLGRNPFGFGYAYPNRVQLQFLKIPHEPIVAAVRKGKSDFDWQTIAYRYYQKNGSEFQSTPPAQTQPTTFPATSPADTQPTTLPFETVQERAIVRAMSADVEAKLREVSVALQERLIADSQSIRGAAARSTTAPATQPAGFGSLEYLQTLADDIEKRFAVRPEIHSIQNTWLAESDLAGLRGIGDSTLDAQKFATYAITQAAAFLPAGKRDSGNALSLFEPSPLFRDAEQNAYVFYLTAAEPAHSPTTLATIQEQVTQDVQRATAYQHALEEATAFMENAKKDGLSAATQPTSRPIIAEDFAISFPNPNTMDIMMFPSYSVGGMAQQLFVAQARDLIGLASKTDPHPIGLITLPSDGKVLVAQLQDVTPKWTGQNYSAYRYASARREEQTRLTKLRSQYFSRDAIEARMNYRATEKPQKKRSTEAS